MIESHVEIRVYVKPWRIFLTSVIHATVGFDNGSNVEACGRTCTVDVDDVRVYQVVGNLMMRDMTYVTTDMVVFVVNENPPRRDRHVDRRCSHDHVDNLNEQRNSRARNRE